MKQSFDEYSNIINKHLHTYFYIYFLQTNGISMMFSKVHKNFGCLLNDSPTIRIEKFYPINSYHKRIIIKHVRLSKHFVLQSNLLITLTISSRPNLKIRKLRGTPLTIKNWQSINYYNTNLKYFSMQHFSIFLFFVFINIYLARYFLLRIFGASIIHFWKRICKTWIPNYWCTVPSYLKSPISYWKIFSSTCFRRRKKLSLW